MMNFLSGCRRPAGLNGASPRSSTFRAVAVKREGRAGA
jgi:hypothetical protein